MTKSIRSRNAKENTEDNTNERLATKEYIQLRKFNLLKRSYENET